MADPAGDIRVIKKKIKGHAVHHGGAWKVAYADFVTAMMAFFLVMWIIGLDAGTKSAIAAYFKDPEAFMEGVRAGNAAFSVTDATVGGPYKPKLQEKTKKTSAEAEKRRLQDAKSAIEKVIAATPEFRVLKKHIDMKIINDGLKIELLESQESMFFDAASAAVKPQTRHLLASIARELGKLPNKIMLEGHTDIRPLNRTDGYTNWELSADRANSARRIMEASGVQPGQVSQVRGYAATEPRDTNNPANFINRRVSIMVEFSDAMNKQITSGALPIKVSRDSLAH